MADPELSSITATLDDVRRRIAGLAESHDAAGDVDTAVDLYEVERSLAVGVRRLSKMIDTERRRSVP